MRIASLMLALFFLLVMILLLLSSFGYTQNYVATRGIVERVIYHENSSDTVVIRFQTRSGEPVTFQVEGNILPSHSVGDNIHVLYNPNHPQEAINGSFAQLWFYPFVSFWLAVLFVALPFFATWFKRYAAQMS